MNAILKALFPKCIIESVDLYEQTVTIAATGSKNFAKCPGCQEISRRVHSYYVRKPQDLPICGCFVRLRLRVRRFRCLNECCLKRTFAERWGDWLKPYAQKTARTVNALYHVSQVAGGEAGCRLLTHLKMKASGPILIRIIRRRPQVEMVNPQIIGVDDWSIRKGRTYGTIIVDLERGVPIDLLPDRTAETLASWLQARKALQIVARDRSTEYAKSIQSGAPAAAQIADRWHLLLNLYQMLERIIRQNHGRLRKVPVTSLPDQESISERRGCFFVDGAGTEAQSAQPLTSPGAVSRYPKTEGRGGKHLEHIQITFAPS